MTRCFDLPNGVNKIVLAGGKGEIPEFKNGGKIQFHFRTFVLNDDGEKTVLDDTKNDHQPFELLIGKKFKLELWEDLLKTMLIDEIAEFVCDSRHVISYPIVSKSWRDMMKKKNLHNHDEDHSHSHQCGFAAFSKGLGYTDLDNYMNNPKPLIFQIELLNVKQPGEYEKDIWSLSLEEKLENIPKWKAEGNMFYKEGNLDKACEKYSQALGCLEQLITREKPGTEEWLNIEKMKIPFLLNYSQCLLSKKEYYKAVEHLTTVLEKDEHNVKAYYRRAKAYHSVFNFDEARKDYEKAKSLDSSLITTIDKELKKIRLDENQKDKEDKERFKNAF